MRLRVSDVSSFFLGIASSVVAALIVAGCFRLQLVFSPKFRSSWNIIKSLRRLRRSGINNIMTSRADYRFLRGGETISRYLLGSVNHTLIYVGFWHAKGVEMENLRNTFTDLTVRGCTIEMILLDPELDDEKLTIVAKHLGLTKDAFRHRLSDAWVEMIHYQNDVPATMRKNFLLKAHTEMIHASAFVIDQGRPTARTLVDFKLFGTEREGTFAIELVPAVAGDSLYRRVTDSFMAIRDEARVRNVTLRLIENDREQSN